MLDRRNNLPSLFRVAPAPPALSAELEPVPQVLALLQIENLLVAETSNWGEPGDFLTAMAAEMPDNLDIVENKSV